MAENEVRDLVIVGAGPAGLSAAIYASRAMLDAVTIEQAGVGGQVLTTTDIDNYPGTPNTTGFELMDAMQRAREIVPRCEYTPEEVRDAQQTMQEAV